MGLMLWGLLGCDGLVGSVEAPCPMATDRLLATADGATIALHHHPGPGEPVLMVHGISSNHWFWDLDEDNSAARWLQARGHDVWLLDLRGHGDARRSLDGTPQISGWTVDDYGRFDVAAAVDHVLRVTGRERLAYVGHSMGGMVGGIFLATGGQRFISSLVLVGSPGTFDRSAPLAELARQGFALGGGSLFWLETGVAADAAAILGPLTPGQLQFRLYNRAHLSSEVEDRMLGRIVSPMSREEMQHFARMIRDERFESADGTMTWTDAMGSVQVPVTGIAGGADLIAGPDLVRFYVESFAGPRRFHVVPEYGHLDLGLGADANRDVWPLIEAGIAWAGTE
jgi:polyhydroxyalkanoate synthase